MGTSLRARFARQVMVTELARRNSIVPRGERTVEQARAELNHQGRLLRLPHDLHFNRAEVGGVGGEWLEADAHDRSARLLYLHGGGYAIGSCDSHRGIAGWVVEAVGIPAFLPEYRLAPEHPFPAALEDALACFEALADEVPASRILVAGDSAGGGLALALALALRDRGRPLPGAVATMSAWTDLTGSGESLHTRADREFMLIPDLMADVAAFYHGDVPPDHPLVSPVFADLSGLPPLLLQVGDDEILLDDSVRVWEQARAAGTEATLRVYPGMWHVWHALARWVPEARRANAEIARFWWSTMEEVPPQRRSTL